MTFNGGLSFVGQNQKPRFDDRETIVLLDSGINLSRIDLSYLCKDKMLDFTNKGLRDKLEHGNLTFLSMQERVDPMKTCIFPIKTFASTPNLSAESYLAALIFLRSFSFEKLVIPFEDISYWHLEVELLENISRRSKIYVSAGNGREFLSEEECLIYPACLSLKIDNENFIVVGSNKDRFNKGPIVKREENDEFQGFFGTSFSASIAAAKDSK